MVGATGTPKMTGLFDPAPPTPSHRKWAPQVSVLRGPGGSEADHEGCAAATLPAAGLHVSP